MFEQLVSRGENSVGSSCYLISYRCYRPRSEMAVANSQIMNEGETNPLVSGFMVGNGSKFHYTAISISQFTAVIKLLGSE